MEERSDLRTADEALQNLLSARQDLHGAQRGETQALERAARAIELTIAVLRKRLRPDGRD